MRLCVAYHKRRPSPPLYDVRAFYLPKKGGRMNYVLGFILIMFMVGLWLAFGLYLPH